MFNPLSEIRIFLLKGKDTVASRSNRFPLSIPGTLENIPVFYLKSQILHDRLDDAYCFVTRFKVNITEGDYLFSCPMTELQEASTATPVPHLGALIHSLPQLILTLQKGVHTGFSLESIFYISILMCY